MAIRSRHQGFTLIELMITVAIIAILARLAWPSYQNYVTRTKLTQAFNQLSAYSLTMQQVYQDTRSYATRGATSGMASWCSGPDSHTWNDALRLKIARPCWIAFTVRVVNDRPSRMRSTS